MVVTFNYTQAKDIILQALKQAQDEGRYIKFWWRDDDATKASPALEQLAHSSLQAQASVLLAVIPQTAGKSLRTALDEHSHLVPCVHGWAHINHAPQGEKKAELGKYRALTEIKGEITTALHHLKKVLGDDILAVMVPPWNRISGDVVQCLVSIGYQGVSGFANNLEAYAPDDLIVASTHIDIIDWRGEYSIARTGKPAGIVASEIAAEILSGRDEIGLLSHHLVHDQKAWDTLNMIAETISSTSNTSWLNPRDIFMQT